MSKYNECIRDGKYALASAGEVCSVETAKSLGIFNRDSYYNGRDYDGVKTFNPAVDSETARSEEICRQNIMGSEATPVCAVMPNAGVGTTAKPGRPGVCVTHGCPPGFEEGRDGLCQKPLEDALVSKKSRCDERWTDWFMLPNYHLGNTFYSVGPGKCYAPCPSGQVPAYARDPVDDTAVDFSSEDDLGTCIDRGEYFNGKYAEGSEFCPIAWVHRLGVTAREIEEQLQTAYDTAMAESGGVKNTHMVDTERERRETALAIMNAASAAMEAVDMPTATQTAACKKLGTMERLQKAYDICEQIKTNEDAFMKRLEDENGDSALKQEQKTMVLKTACDALFCNEKWDPYTAEMISREPICIKNIKNVDLMATDPSGGAGGDATAPLPTAKKQRDFFRTSIGRAAAIIMLCIFGTLIYFAITLFVWPKIIVPIWEFIKRLLTGWKSSKQVQQLEALKDDIEAAGNLPAAPAAAPEGPRGLLDRAKGIADRGRNAAANAVAAVDGSRGFLNRAKGVSANVQSAAAKAVASVDGKKGLIGRLKKRRPF